MTAPAPCSVRARVVPLPTGVWDTRRTAPSAYCRAWSVPIWQCVGESAAPRTLGSGRGPDRRALKETFDVVARVVVADQLAVLTDVEAEAVGAGMLGAAQEFVRQSDPRVELIRLGAAVVLAHDRTVALGCCP